MTGAHNFALLQKCKAFKVKASTVPVILVVPFFETMARSTLATNCVSQYHQYIWGCCFGLVTVVSAPLLAVVGLALGLYKSLHDHCLNRGLLRA